MTVYTENFFRELREGARRSAREIVPIVVRLLRPESVVDVGCGLGTWLSVFAENGVGTILGIDGAYVDRASLEILGETFLPHDLSQPLRLDRSFDLATSLEVAEHLPEEHAETFVDSLTRLAPVVLFSAAIPYQGGTNHVNEQWPEYWAALFEKRGYVPVDCIRKQVWQNGQVEWWYAQNILLYVEESRLDGPPFSGRFQKTPLDQLAIVHPKQYLYTVGLTNAAPEAPAGSSK